MSNQEKQFVISRNLDTGESFKSINIKLDDTPKVHFNSKILIVVILLLMAFILSGFVEIPLYSRENYNYSIMGNPVFDFTSPVLQIVDYFSGIGETASHVLSDIGVNGSAARLYLITWTVYNNSESMELDGHIYLIVYGSMGEGVEQYQGNITDDPLVPRNYRIYAYDDSECSHPFYNIKYFADRGFYYINKNLVISQPNLYTMYHFPYYITMNTTTMNNGYGFEESVNFVTLAGMSDNELASNYCYINPLAVTFEEYNFADYYEHNFKIIG